MNNIYFINGLSSYNPKIDNDINHVINKIYSEFNSYNIFLDITNKNLVYIKNLIFNKDIDENIDKNTYEYYIKKTEINELKNKINFFEKILNNIDYYILIIAHSHGSMLFKKILDNIDKKLYKKIFYIGIGPIINIKYENYKLQSIINITNINDDISILLSQFLDNIKIDDDNNKINSLQVNKIFMSFFKVFFPEIDGNPHDLNNYLEEIDNIKNLFKKNDINGYKNELQNLKIKYNDSKFYILSD